MSNKTSTRRSGRRAARSPTQINPIIIVGLTLVAIAAWISWNALQGSGSSTVQLANTVGIELGQIAPDFSVPTLNSQTFRLADQRGKPTVILFMAYWCGRCIPEATALGRLQREYGDRVSLAALDVDPSSTPELLTQFKEAAGNGAIVWAFDTAQVLSTFQVTVLDTTLILNRDGHIVFRDEVPTSYDTLKAELAKLEPSP